MALDTETPLTTAGGLPPEPTRPPTPGGFSLRPAMVVLGLAVLILVLFVAIGFMSSHARTQSRTGRAATAVPGSALRPAVAGGLLSPIVTSGDPPANVRGAVLVPTGSMRVGSQDNSAGSGPYDSQVVLRSSASQEELLTFFSSAMKLEGWQVFSQGPARNHPGAIEVLGKLAGSDGYYWEMGAIVAPTSFPAGGPANGQTDVTIRLLQQSDDAS